MFFQVYRSMPKALYLVEVSFEVVASLVGGFGEVMSIHTVDLVGNPAKA